MKLETKIAALRLHLAAVSAKAEADKLKTGLASAVDHAARATSAPDYFSAAVAARRAQCDAEAALAKIPAPRRKLAAEQSTLAAGLALNAARLGQLYSGQTDFRVEWGPVAKAETRTSDGAQYSRRCSYRQTDAAHVVTLDPAGVPLLCESPDLRAASARDGLPLVALYPDGLAVWVRSKGKAIASERGWIAGEGAHCYYSTVSLDHAKAGLARKLAAEKRELERVKADRKANRRARLIARFCSSAVATLADAKGLGFCDPGIRSFQSRHGIGDSAPLPELIRTGDPSAVRLALHVARRVRKPASV